MHTILPDAMSPRFLAAGAPQYDSLTTCIIAVYLVWFTLLVIGFSLIVRKFGNAPTPALAHTHVPITRGGVIYAVGTLSRANCARCLADKRERGAAAAAARARAAQDVLASTLPPYPPSLSPAPLSPLPGLGLTGLDVPRASPGSSLPGYRAATAFVPRGRD